MVVSPVLSNSAVYRPMLAPARFWFDDFRAGLPQSCRSRDGGSRARGAEDVTRCSPRGRYYAPRRREQSGRMLGANVDRAYDLISPINQRPKNDLLMASSR